MPIRPFLAGQDLTERASPKCQSRMNLVTFIDCSWQVRICFGSEGHCLSLTQLIDLTTPSPLSDRACQTLR